jgi:dephospho-CoA kinase
LRADPDARAEYLSVKQKAASAVPAEGGVAQYNEAKEPWFRDAYRRAWNWADTLGWRP